MAQNFLYLGLGIAVVLIAVLLAGVLMRLNRTLVALELLVVTTTEEMRDTLPEVRQALGTVNDIATGVNFGLRTAGSGVDRLGVRLGQTWRRVRVEGSAITCGIRVGGQSLLGAFGDKVRLPGAVEIKPLSAASERSRTWPATQSGLEITQYGNQEE